MSGPQFHTKIFADGADLEKILVLATDPRIRGFTTNPTLMREAGVVDYSAFALELLQQVSDRPISFEVFADDPEEMHRQAKIISSWADNVYVKIPITTTKGASLIPLVHDLSLSGVKVNVTAVFTLEQVKEATHALRDGADSYISIFAGRIADAGVDPLPTMSKAVELMKLSPRTECIWASPREVLNLVQAESVGCHVITMTQGLLNKLDGIGKDLDQYSLETVQMFFRDATRGEVFALTMSVIVAKAPLRISLGGGGTDLPSYYREHEGFLVAGAIDKYVYILIHAAFNRTFQLKYSKHEETQTPEMISHPIFREALTRYWDGDPLEITSIADVPAGTGMGSSGSFTVALLKALAQCRHISTTPPQLAEQASEIEINFLSEPVGKQDPYIAAHGGICAFTFHRDDTVTVEPLSLSIATHEKLRNQLMLFYTGKTRSASAVLQDQNARSLAGDSEMIENLHRTKEMGFKSRQLLESGDLESYAKLMNEHWLNKRSRSDGVANSHIDHLYDVAMENGAIGAKLIGAGGGGFLLVYSAIPSLTRESMAMEGATEQPFEFEFGGASAQGLV